MKRDTATISIIIPLHNGSATIKETLRSLIPQMTSDMELVVVENGSLDNSADIVASFLGRSQIQWQMIRSRKPVGLAGAYNLGLRNSKSELVVTVHQDMVLKRHAMEKLIRPLSTDSEAVASYHIADIPFKQWRTFNFWQKILFDRGAGVKLSGLNGKFDCFRKDILKKVGYFDEETFHSAGEDEDIVRKIAKHGKIIPSGAEVIHNHGKDNKFGFGDLVKKHTQYAEAQGALLRKYGFPGVATFCLTFFRELILFSLIIPAFRLVGLFLMVIYLFLYTKNLYLTDFPDPRITLLPIVNIILLFASLGGSVLGFVSGRQRL